MICTSPAAMIEGLTSQSVHFHWKPRAQISCAGNLEQPGGLIPIKPDGMQNAISVGHSTAVAR
jgi:hypothetical protein